MPSTIDKNKTQIQNTGEDTIDFRELLATIFKSWYIFLIGVVVCLSLAFIYTYYAACNWKIASKILVEDPKNNPSLAGASGLGADFGSIFNVKSNADNEVQILRSRSLMDNTVRQLQLNVRIYNKTGLRSAEIYQEAPFKVSLRYKADTLIYRKYKIAFDSDNTYHITNSTEEVNLAGKVGQPVRLNQYDLTIDPLPGRKLHGEYFVGIESIDRAVNSLSESVGVSLSAKQSTTIDLSLTYPHPKKGEVILDELMNLYLLSNLKNKIKIADNTINFIDDRIALVGSELNDVETQFERYRKEQNIADITTQSKVLVSSASEYYDKLNQEETQLRIFNELQKILNNPQNKATIPSSMVAPSDVSFGQGINTYNQL